MTVSVNKKALAGATAKAIAANSKESVNIAQFHKFSEKGKPYEIIDDAIERYLTQDKLQMIVLNNQPYLYRNGYYQYDKDGKQIKAYIRDLIYPELVTINRINRVYHLIIADVALSKKNEDVNQYPHHWINFRNGMLDVKTGEMHEHDPRYYALNQIPWPYSAVAPYDGTTTDKFLRGLIPDPDDREMYLAYSAYCMTIDTHLQKFLVIVGKPGAGKSTAINIVTRVVGAENISSIGLQKLGERFMPTNLLHKLLNACGDLPKTALKETDTIKQATGEDLLTGEYKGGDIFAFYSYAKLLFSANQMPVSLDEKSDAFYRRLLAIEVKEQGAEIPDLSQKLKDDAEVLGFIRASVDALARLYKSGDKIDSPNSQRFVHDYHRESDSVMSFMEDCTEPKHGAKVSRRELYREYDAYCTRNGWAAVSNRTFFGNLRGKGYADFKSCGEWYVKDIDITLG